MMPGALIQELRAENGLSQRELAHRAGTSQSAIARIERGEEEVTWSRLRTILLAMGEEPVLTSAPLAGRYDALDLMDDRRLSPATRLGNGLAFNEFATEVALAGRAARRARGGA